MKSLEDRTRRNKDRVFFCFDFIRSVFWISFDRFCLQLVNQRPDDRQDSHLLQFNENKMIDIVRLRNHSVIYFNLTTFTFINNVLKSTVNILLFSAKFICKRLLWFVPIVRISPKHYHILTKLRRCLLSNASISIRNWQLK